MPVELNVYQVVMHFGYGDRGWSEKHVLAAASISDAKTAATKLVGWRLCCLPRTCELVWAAITKDDTARDSVAVHDFYPLPGLYTVAESEDTDPTINPNLATDALHIRFETDDGKFKSGWVHGVPDALVEATELTSAIANQTADPGTPAVGSDTWFVLVGKYLKVVRDSTKYFRKRVSGANIIKETFPISRSIIRKVGYKKVGRPFGK